LRSGQAKQARPALSFLREDFILSSAHHPLLPLALPFSRETNWPPLFLRDHRALEISSRLHHWLRLPHGCPYRKGRVPRLYEDDLFVPTVTMTGNNEAVKGRAGFSLFTEVPTKNILGNQASGVRSSRKPTCNRSHTYSLSLGPGGGGQSSPLWFEQATDPLFFTQI